MDGITVLDRNADGPADAVRVSKVNGMWMVTPDEAAGFVNAKIVKTRWSSNCFLITRPHKARWLSCTVEPGKSHLADWRTLLDDEEGSFIADGKNAMAKHVISADEKILAEDEVFVVDESDNLIATGMAVLAGCEMLGFNFGTAVKVRQGVNKK